MTTFVLYNSIKSAQSNFQVLMRALRDFNMPKIVTEDVTIFLGLLGDLFPGLGVERKRDPEFEQAVRQTTLELRLQPEEAFILKVRHEILQLVTDCNEKAYILFSIRNDD